MGLTRAARRAGSIAKLRVERAHGVGSPPGPVFVHVGDLVLHGFPPSTGRRIGDGVQSELARLFAAGGVPYALAAAAPGARVDAGSVRVSSSANARAIGSQIGRAVYGGGKP